MSIVLLVEKIVSFVWKNYKYPRKGLLVGFVGPNGKNKKQYEVKG